MSVPRCPICGCEAANSSQPKTDSAAQYVERPGPRLVVCHCTEGHRFLVMLDDRVPGQSVVRLGRTG